MVRGVAVVRVAATEEEDWEAVGKAEERVVARAASVHLGSTHRSWLSMAQTLVSGRQRLATSCDANAYTNSGTGPLPVELSSGYEAPPYTEGAESETPCGQSLAMWPGWPQT